MLNEKAGNKLIRDDLSDRLIHLTRGETNQEAAQAFLGIIESKALTGGTGYIKGKFRCVCFSEAPIGKLSHILANPSVHGMIYSPFGVMVSKEWLFSKGGRPVIYQPDSEFELLDECQKYRHKIYEPDMGVDFTWEREWRLKTYSLKLDPSETTLVVPNRAWADYFFNKHTTGLSGMAMLTAGFTGPSKYPWHFIALEDLGVSIPNIDSPK